MKSLTRLVFESLKSYLGYQEDDVGISRDYEDEVLSQSGLEPQSELGSTQVGENPYCRMKPFF